MRGRWSGAAALLLAVAAMGLVATAARVQAAGCAALDYQAALRSAAAALQHTPADVAGAQRQVSALVATEPTSTAALQPVLDDLSAAPPHLDDARVRLDSMSATLAYPPRSVCNENSDAARGALHAVYGSPDFRHLDDSTQPGFLAGILNFLRDLLSRAAGALGPLGAVLLAIVVVGLGLLLAWRRWQGSAARRGAGFEEPAPGGDDPDAEWTAAQQAAAAGEYREAVRRAFRSALLEVATRGRLDIDPTWTTRELLQRSHADAGVLVALAAAAALFERAWYAGVAVGADDWTSAEQRCATVRQLARGSRAAAR